MCHSLANSELVDARSKIAIAELTELLVIPDSRTVRALKFYGKKMPKFLIINNRNKGI